MNKFAIHHSPRSQAGWADLSGCIFCIDDLARMRANMDDFLDSNNDDADVVFVEVRNTEIGF